MNSLFGGMEENLKKLRGDAMRGKWSDVFEKYKQDKAIRSSKLTAVGDTVLHMAVSSGQEKVVANMVDLLVGEDDGESRNVNAILGAENNRKNTPLHLAATMGNVEMCKKIGGKSPFLIAKRNVVGETPIFLAALNGKKEAFLWLHYMYVESHRVFSTDLAHCIRDNDDTILHCAIEQQHFDVAIEIVHLYKGNLKDMMRRNKKGLSPLHLIAAKPTFRSTSVIVPSDYDYRRKYIEKNYATTLERLQIQSKKEDILAVFKFIQWLMLVITLILCPFVLQEVRMMVVEMPKLMENSTWSFQIMNELLRHASDEDLSQIISRTTSNEQLAISLQADENNDSEATKTSSAMTFETPLIIAVKNGMTEMVEKILELFPSRIEDVNAEGKNILLLAAEYKQTKVFKFLCKQKWITDSLFGQVDKEGNNALHLAAKLGVDPDWVNPGEKLSMEKEINWFEYVKRSMPCDLLNRYNEKNETPDDIFRESHKELMKSEGKWVTTTSQACSVVSTLVASAAFATRTNVPGGYDDKGYAILRNKPSLYKLFVGSSFGALFFSLMSTICFLSVLASRYQSVGSWRFVSMKLYFGISFMFYSIVCLWISFCAADFFMLDDASQKLHKAIPRYILWSWGIFILVTSQFKSFLFPIMDSTASADF